MVSRRRRGLLSWVCAPPAATVRRVRESRGRDVACALPVFASALPRTSGVLPCSEALCVL